jgi:neutral ceramidase
MKTALLFAIVLTETFTFGAELSWSAGVASVKITPEQKVPLVGYASRTNAWTEVEHDVYAKALALKDEKGNRAVLVTLDLCTFSPTVGEPICEEISRKTGLKRSQILLNLSHTHSGPATGLSFPGNSGISPALTNNIVEYTKVFQKKVAQCAEEALSKMEPVRLSYGSGVASFAMNRREMTTNGVILGVNPRGYVDRTVPVLRIDSESGEVKAVLFGYACHGTTLDSDSLLVSPDYPGYARDVIQKKYPKAEALFIASLGGSANPYPRTGLQFAKDHGAVLGAEVCRVLDGKLRAIRGPLTTEMDSAELPLQSLSRTELEEASTAKGKSWMRGAAKEMLSAMDRGETMPKKVRAPVAVWQFGADLTLVALAHEVVGEYAPLIEREIGPMNLWLAAYCNQVSGYIPAKVTLRDGGYECRGLYEGAGLFAPETEDVLVGRVGDLSRRAGRPR